MIKTKKGKVTVKGSRHEIMADLSCITRSIYKGMVDRGEKEEEVLKDIEKCFKRATMSDEEILKDVVEALVKIVSNNEEGEKEDE